MFALVLGLLFSGKHAVAQVYLTLTPGTGSPTTSATISLSFGTNGTALAGLQWSIVFPSNQLTAISATAGTAATTSGKTLSCASAPGSLRCVLNGLNQNSIGAGVVANIQLAPAAEIIRPTISLSGPVGVDSIGDQVPAAALAGLAIQTTALPKGQVNQPYGPVVTSATGGNGPITWFATGLPNGLTLSNTGVLTGTPAASGTFAVVLTVVDSGGAIASVTISLTIGPPPAPLTLNGPASLGGFLPAVPISADYPATGGKPPYKWSAPQGLPAGLGLNPSTGALTGSVALPGNYTFPIEVADAESTSISTSLNVSLFVLGIATTSLPNGTVNVAYSQSLAATGGLPPYIWSGAPADGLSLSQSGMLTGIPTASGPFSIPVSVTSGGVTFPANIAFTIGTQIQPLEIPGGTGNTPITLGGGRVALPYYQTLDATNGQPPYSWSVVGGALPTGVSIDSSGTLSGTPNLPGAFAFTAQVSDSSGASVASPFAIPISPPPLAITTGSSLPNGIVGSGYPVQVVSAAGGIGPYTFRATGALPGGLTLSPVGLISGFPDTTGVFSFNVTATDSQSMAQTTAASFQIVVEPAHTDLILSRSSVLFSAVVGASSVPPGAIANVSVASNGPPLSWLLSVTPASPWLDVNSIGTTPGVVSIALDASNTPQLGQGSYTTSVVLTCITPAGASAPSPCAGNSQTINVTLNVISAPPQVAVLPGLLTFFAPTGSPQPVSQLLNLQNQGGRSITIDSLSVAAHFISVTGVPLTIPAGSSTYLTVTVNPTGLSAGYYESTIVLNSSAGAAPIGVALLVSQNGTMSLAPAGIEFESRIENGAVSAPGSSSGAFLVHASSTSPVTWTATVLPAASWLQLSTSNGTSTFSNPGSVSFSVNPAAAPPLPQTNYAIIQVSSGDVVDSPQDFVVLLHVGASGSPVQLNVAPAGLAFTATGASTVPPQTVQVLADSAAPVGYQASSDSSWLLVAPGVAPGAARGTGSVSSASPGSSTVSVNAGGLSPGVYRGNISYQLTNSGSEATSLRVNSVTVTLVVETQAATCVPTQLVPTQTGLLSDFVQPVAGPAPLSVSVTDDCGRPISGGQVVATFSNGDPALILTALDATSGLYSGAWTPRTASGQVTVAVHASAPGFEVATIRTVGQVVPGAGPHVNLNGVLNIFAPETDAPIAPGAIVQIYGSSLAPSVMTAPTIPLPTTLNQTSVLIGGQLAPLYYVSPGQINAQVPFELQPGQTYQVMVDSGGAMSTPASIQLLADSPGIAQFPWGRIIAQHLDGSLVQETSPATPSEYLVFYAAGMGLTNPTVPSGTASPSTNLAVPLDNPALRLNGELVTNVLFDGLTPTLVGVYQVNFQVPPDAPNGDLQLILTQGSGFSSAAILPVHK